LPSPRRTAGELYRPERPLSLKSLRSLTVARGPDVAAGLFHCADYPGKPADVEKTRPLAVAGCINDKISV
jgi:hypothetical protein